MSILSTVNKSQLILVGYALYQTEPVPKQDIPNVVQNGQLVGEITQLLHESDN